MVVVFFAWRTQPLECYVSDQLVGDASNSILIPSRRPQFKEANKQKCIHCTALGVGRGLCAYHSTSKFGYSKLQCCYFVLSFENPFRLVSLLCFLPRRFNLQTPQSCAKQCTGSLSTVCIRAKWRKGDE